MHCLPYGPALVLDAAETRDASGMGECLAHATRSVTT